MHSPWWKRARVLVALAMLAGLSAALLDFRSLVPHRLGHVLASVQLVPAALGAAAGLTLSVVALLAILALTLALGRVYCSAICPLGIFQDIVSRLARLVGPQKRFLRHAKPLSWLRYGVLGATLLAVLAGWSGVALALLDPYSNYGRIASDLFRPVGVLLNNGLVGVAEAFGWAWLYRAEPHWVGAGALAVPGVALTVVVVLSAWRGRLYCNTLCPVGTLLGVIARRAAWRIEIDQDACRKCGACLKACKAQCIDLRTGEIDATRCVGCFNCVPVCTEGGIGLVWKWRRGAAKAPEAAAPESSAPPADEGRRAFISGSALALTAAAGVAGAVVAEAGRRRRGQGRGPQDQGIVFGPVCPPGSKSVERFLDVCTACHLCVSACPTGVLRPASLEYGWAGLTKPQMDFSKSFCNFDCNRCGEVCPEGAILPLALAEKKTTQLGVARFRRYMCIVHEEGTACGACAEHCPTGAVHMVPFRDGLTIPQVEPEQCIGCGACEYACPVRPARAIRVEALPVHGRAIVVKDKPAESPAPVDDFPF